MMAAMSGIPVDPHYMSWKVRLTGYEAQFIALADRINRAMPEHVVTVVAEALTSAAGRCAAPPSSCSA